MQQYKITFNCRREDCFGNSSGSLKGTTILEAPTNKIAIQTASELYETCSDWDIKPIEKTCDLVRELSEREGVRHIEVEPYMPVEIKVNGKEVHGGVKEGPCRILVVYD